MRFRSLVVASLSLVSAANSAFSQTSEVRLLSAKPFYYAVSGMSWNYTDFIVHTEDIGTSADQRVYIHYNDGTAAWADYDLGLQGDYGDHLTWTGRISDSSLEFVVGFETSAGTYWDNNFSANYDIDYGFGGADIGVVGDNVGLYSARRYATFYFSGGTLRSKTGLEGTIYVQDLDPTKIVGAYATANNWSSYTYLPATYDTTFTTGAFSSEVERWTFGTNNLTSGSPSTIEVMVLYWDVTGGAIYYDNNFGQNYSLTRLSYSTIY